MKYRKSIFRRFDDMLKSLAQPLVCEPVLFVFTFIMFGGFTIVKQASKQILSGVPLHEYSYLLFSICIILTLGYLFAALCTWIRK